MQQTPDVNNQLKNNMLRLFLFVVFLYVIHVMSEVISKVMDNRSIEYISCQEYKIITLFKTDHG